MRSNSNHSIYQIEMNYRSVEKKEHEHPKFSYKNSRFYSIKHVLYLRITFTVLAFIAVASEISECSVLGKNTLKKGGNAVDAAIVTMLCVGSINSFASGIGGGGFLLLRLPSKNASMPESSFKVIDFRETAPRKANLTMFHHPLIASKGALSVCVPGELRGMALVHQRYGRLPWHRLVRPIVQLNRQGFRVPKYLAHQLIKHESMIQHSKVWSDVFMKQGRLVKEGDLIQRLNYANTLQQIAEQGVDVFYNGSIASSTVQFLQSQGGILDFDDLQHYQPILRQAINTTYRQMHVYSTPVPASGHLLLFMLNLMETFPKKNVPDGLFYHRMVESLRYAYAKRSELSDPKFFNISSFLSELLSKETAMELRRNISDVTTFPPEHYLPKYYDPPSHGTSHISVVDEDGIAVSMTSTINLSFGSLLMDPTTGIIFNNEMDDFSFPKFNNSFGIPPSPFNIMTPLKRPMSSMVPTIVEHQNELKIVIGGSGGSHILSSVFQTLLYMLELHWSVTGSVCVPRFHDQLFPNHCELENEFPGDFAEALTMRHHQIRWLPEKKVESAVQAIFKRMDGMLEAVSDFRKDGAPSGY